MGMARKQSIHHIGRDYKAAVPAQVTQPMFVFFCMIWNLIWPRVFCVPSSCNIVCDPFGALFLRWPWQGFIKAWTLGCVNNILISRVTRLSSLIFRPTFRGEGMILKLIMCLKNMLIAIDLVNVEPCERNMNLKTDHWISSSSFILRKAHLIDLISCY